MDEQPPGPVVPLRDGLALAEWLLDASTLARCLARLEDQGLLSRQADKADRRALWVVLAPPGRALAEQLSATLGPLLLNSLEGDPGWGAEKMGNFGLTPGVRGRTVKIHADKAEVK